MISQSKSTTRTTSTVSEIRSRRGRYLVSCAKRFAVLLLMLASLAQLTPAQSDSDDPCAYCKPKIWVGFNGSLCSTSLYRVYFAGSLKEWGYGNCNGTFTPLDDEMVGLTLDQTYQLKVEGACATHINFFEVPDDYVIEVNGVETRTIDKVGSVNGAGDGVWNVTVRRKCECDSNNAGESRGPKQGSVMWDVGLGSLSDGRSAGSISLHSAVLDANIYTPLDLIYSPPGFTNEVDVVLNSNSSLRQVKVPQALADVVAIDSNQYEIRFYRHSDVGAKDGNGIYAVSNQPYVIWRIRNPHLGFTDQLEISKIQNGVTDSSLYTWTSATDAWSLTTGNGTRTETKTKLVDPATGDWTETFTVTNGSGQVISKVARTYHQFGWHEELIREIVDPDGASLATTYIYYQNSSEVGKYRKLKSVSRPDGSWEQYDYDTTGNQVLILRPWKDQSLASASESTSYAIRKTFSNFDGITLSKHALFVSSVIEKIAGVTVRKTTYSRTATTINGQPAIVESETLHASASLSQTTITTRYHSTASPLLANRIASIQYADGRKDTYTYEKGDYVPNADPSLSQFIPNPNGLGERETVVHGTVSSPAGVAFKSTQDVLVRDQFGHTVLQETYVYTGSGYARTTWSVMDYDNRGHLTQKRNSNGTVTSAVWNGDLKLSEIDENGIETTYTYDALNHVATRTKKGVAATASFPAQADIVTTYITDTEGRTTQETIAAGGLSLTRTTSFDIAGRVKIETNVDGLTTTYIYTNGGRTETVVVPGGATRITDKFLDGQIKSTLGTAVVTKAFDYGVNADGTPFSQEFVGSAGTSSPRWTKSSTDWMGRVVKIEKPSFIAGSNLLQISVYNSSSQLQSESTMVGTTKLLADKLYEYDAMGNRIRTGADINGSGTLTPGSTDRIIETEEILQQNGSDWWLVTTTKTYLTNNSSTTTTTGTQSERLSNFAVNGSENIVSEGMTTDEAGNQKRQTKSVDRGAKIAITRTDTARSATDAVETSFNGLVQSSGSTIPTSLSTYTYDALGRLLSITDPTSGINSRAYHSTTGQLISESRGPQTTAYEYYPSSHLSAGRLKVKTDPNGKMVYFNYNSRGQVVQTWGEATYPIEYVFDDFGQMREMHTFREGSGWQGASWPTATISTMDLTKWIYHQPTGLLATKQDASSKQTVYTYDILGHLATRKWARLDGIGNSLTTTYSYNPNTGELSGITYSDATEPVTYVLDRGGRTSTVTDAAGTHTLTYNAAAQLLSDQISSGLLQGITINVGYDAFLRRQSLQATRNAVSLTSQTYGYDASSRLETVISGGQTVTYGYSPMTGLLNTTSFTGGTQIVRTYDSLGRLETIATVTPSAGTVSSYTYTYNNLNQRSRVTREDNSYWSYVYNDRGEVVSGKKYWSDNSPVAGQQFEYAFDTLGNRTSTKAGGDQQGLNLREASYTTNSLNQYQQRTVPGAVDVRGSAHAAATVTVNNQATSRRDDYFYKELAVDNTSSPIYLPVNVFAIRAGVGGNGEDAVMQNDGYVYLPKNLESFSYDADGNLTSDGRWNYTWDAENRLRSMQAISSVPVEARKRLEFVYDYGGRRIQKKVFDWNTGTGTYVLQSTTRFVYDGWNLIAELDENNSLIRAYTRGQDISGTPFEAAGVGSALIINDAGIAYQVSHDGNGNVGLVLKASDSAVVATYDYDPFGKAVQVVGSYATTNPLTFGSAYKDKETQLLYYGYRYYEPGSGRWLSKDPLAENGSLNMYSFLANNGINAIERLGLDGLVVAGGTSVKDPNGHDESAWNFLNTAARRAKELVQIYKQNPRKYKDAKVYVIMYTPSYERRAVSDKLSVDTFLNKMLEAAARDGWTLVTIRSKDELTYHFNKSKTKGVTSIDYFGHSNADNLFLEYSSVRPAESTDMWGAEDARNVRKEIFSEETTFQIVSGRRVRKTTPTAVFFSFGCNSGDPGGLAEQLHEIWGIITKGSVGSTGFWKTGQDGSYWPTTEGGWVTYPRPR